MRAVRSPDPHFAQAGYVRAEFKPRGLSGRVPLKPPACLRLRLRSLFGIGIRAEAVAYLATHPWGHAIDITGASAYSSVGVQQALREMADSGLLVTTRRHREKYYGLEPLRRQAILGASGTAGDTPEWIHWVRLLQGLAILLRFARRQDIAKASDDLQKSELRAPAKSAWQELSEAELPLGITLDLDGTASSLEESVHAMLRGLLARFDIRFGTPAREVSPEDPREARLLRRLQLLGPGPAAFYRDACRLMTAEPMIESITHVVGHLLRELESALRDVLKGPVDLKGKEAIGWILKKLEIHEDSPTAKTWMELELHKAAHRDNLRAPRPVGQDFQRTWEQVKQVLDIVLEHFEAHYGTHLDEVDRLLAVANPTNNDLKQLKGSVPDPSVAMRYFFDKLDNPAWIPLLDDGGYFSEPAASIKEGDSIRLEVWPPSRFLARMAGRAPDLVHPILLRIAGTRNTLVIEDCLDAALKNPPKMDTGLVPHAEDWLKGTMTPLLPDKMGDFMSHLAKGGEIDAALDLARALFALKASRDKGGEPQAQFDAWEYNQLLESHWPDVAKAAGERALGVLCKLLSSAIESSSYASHRGIPEDFSETWYGDVDGFQHHRERDPLALLARAVRDTALEIARNDDKRIQPVLKVLEGESWKIHGRIALHVLAALSDKAVDIIASRLVDTRILELYGHETELGKLMAAGFGRMVPEDRRKLLREIESGLGGRIRESELEGWRQALLSPIVNELPDDWRAEHAEWLKGLPAAPRPKYEVSTMWIGPRSPKTSEELAGMEVPALIHYLATWSPSGEFDGPDAGGLGQILTDVVAGNPEKYAASAGSFAPLSRLYSAALLWGLQRAARHRKAFAWPEVLTLCESIVKAREAAENQQDSGRRTVADLLNAGLHEKATGIPFSERKRVWALLYTLTTDPDPTPVQEERYAINDRPAVELALNSTRGQALNAVIRYALWVRHHLGLEPGGKKQLRQASREMSEAFQVLDAHLNVDREFSLGVRSVYGQWFPQIVDLDGEWARAHTEEIFPLHADSARFLDAAWETYLVYSRPNGNVLKLLRAQYERAIKGLSDHNRRHRGAEIENHLIGHLVTFYAWGLLDLGEQEGLLKRFYACADDRQRGLLLDVAGRTMKEGPPEIPSDVMERLKALWSWRLAAARKGFVPEFRREMAAFGRWFVSGKLDADWALHQLRESLRLAGTTDPDYLVVEELVDLYRRRPAEALDCIELMVKGAGPGFGIHDWKRRVHPILKEAMRSDAAPIKGSAERIIHRLIARGHTEFKEILSPDARREAR